MSMPPEAIQEELRRQAFALARAHLDGDKEAFDALAGSDEEAAVLLPVVTGVLLGALLQLVGPAELRKQLDSSLTLTHRGAEPTDPA